MQHTASKTAPPPNIMLNIKYQHSWLHCTSRKDIFLYITQICKTSEHSATGKSLPHLWHTAQHSIHTQHRKYRIHQEYSTQHKIYHVYIRNTAGRDLCFAVGQAQARPHPPFKRGFLPWICSQCVSIVLFNALFIEEYIQGNLCLTHKLSMDIGYSQHGK